MAEREIIVYFFQKHRIYCYKQSQIRNKQVSEKPPQTNGQ